MSTIWVNNNKIKYTPLTSGLQGTFNSRTGPNKFGESLSSSTKHVTYTTTWYKGQLSLLDDGGTAFKELSRFDIHGTITKNIEDGILYYQITSIGPANDPTVIIPANPYSNTDTFDVTLWEHYGQLNNVGLVVYIIAFCKDTDTAKTAKFSFDITTNAFYY